MARKNVNYYLVKTTRLTGWLLLLLMLVYVVTGLRMRGELGLEGFLDYDPAHAIHQLFIWPLIVVFVVHSVVTVYFAFRRWGWIGKRTQAPGSRNRPGH